MYMCKGLYFGLCLAQSYIQLALHSKTDKLLHKTLLFPEAKFPYYYVGIFIVYFVLFFLENRNKPIGIAVKVSDINSWVLYYTAMV